MKFSKFLVIFILKALAFGALIVAASCSSDPSKSNKVFSTKYGKDIKKISLERKAPKAASLEDRLDFTAPMNEDFSRYTNSNANQAPEYYSTQQFANQAPAQNGFRFPEEMFENNYNPIISSPFRKIGAEFDAINVPSQDAYGVKAGLSDKEYLLVSRKLLQKNVDQINAQRNADDVNNSRTLIAEQGSLKRKAKMVKIFGQESVVVDEDDDFAEEDTKGKSYGDKVKSKKSKKASPEKSKAASNDNSVAASSNPAQATKAVDLNKNPAVSDPSAAPAVTATVPASQVSPAPAASPSQPATLSATTATPAAVAPPPAANLPVAIPIPPIPNNH